MRRRTLVVPAVLVAVGATTATLVRTGHESPARSDEGDAGARLASLPPPLEPAFEVPTPELLRTNAAVSRWAPVLREAIVRARPASNARHVAALGRFTPEGTANLVLVIAQRKDAQGRLWVRVRLPILPNGSTGWVQRHALGGYRFVRTRLVVDLERLQARLLRDGHAVFRARVGVGRRGSPTPTGEFYIRNRLTTLSRAVYGPIAFGTSARSSVLTDWPAKGFIGIHGTDEPELLPGRVSHGCIRMRNADILRLAELMPVGTPVTIR